MSAPAAHAPDPLQTQFEQEGYCIQEGVLSEAECSQLIEAGKQLPDFREHGITRPAMMPHRTNPLFLQAMKNPAIVSRMERLVGGRVSALQTEFFYCAPGTRGFSNHQDNFYVEAPYGAFASAWLALTDTHRDKGGLVVYPGTQREGMLPTRKIHMSQDTGQDPNANNEETIIPASYQAVNASVPKGAVLYIHCGLVHGSNPNITQESRYVLLMTYIRKGEKFRPGNYANREEVDVYS